MADQGAGTYTILSEIVAEELKIPLSQIRIRQLDTQTGVKDTGVGGSRATRVYGNAGYAAALKAVAVSYQAQLDVLSSDYRALWEAEPEAVRASISVPVSSRTRRSRTRCSA